MQTLFRYRRLALVLGLLLFLVPTLLYAYVLMPFPGSQTMETTALAYTLHSLVLPARIVGALLLLVPVLHAFLYGRLRGRIGMALLSLALIAIVYAAERVVRADVMFREPGALVFADAAHNRAIKPQDLVIGVEHNGVAKAYPVDLLGYHHKVQDSVGSLPVLVTYCTMCRTGRVYDPTVDGAVRHFRLVGAQHYNAVIEDDATGSWWYQATGEAVAGAKSGSTLRDIPSEQVTLASWSAHHPGTLVMQPDPTFAAQYSDLEGYGYFRRSTLDSTTGKIALWTDRSWVVGVEVNKAERAYEWNDLLAHRAINDTVAGTPILVALENDTASFHAWRRTVDGRVLEFLTDSAGRGVVDRASGSLWSWNGEAVEGVMQGRKLEPVTIYQEYWRSWRTFHPGTSRWEQRR